MCFIPCSLGETEGKHNGLCLPHPLTIQTARGQELARAVMKQWASLGDGCILRVEQPNVSSILMWSTPSQCRRVSQYWRCSVLPHKGAPAEAAVCSMNPHFCESTATDRCLQIQCVCGSFISASSAQWNDAGSRKACAASCQILLCD